MGLDMYIYKKKYFSDYSDEDSAEKFKKVKEIVDEPIDSFTTAREVAYWRKANAIHKWFEDKVAKRTLKDCENLPLKKENLVNLISDCKAVLNNKKEASKILPTQTGFFFGPSEYDEYYFSALESTIEMRKFILNTWDEKCDYEYHAWW